MPVASDPGHLAIDQQDRIWVSNSDNTVTRFPVSDPGKAERIKVGYVPRGVAIDSLGNAWVANALGHPGTAEMLKLVEAAIKSKVEGLFESAAAKADAAPQAWIDLYNLAAKYPGGSVSMVRPDGTVLPPFDGGKSINGPWGIAIDGNDNVWVANNWDLPDEGFKKVPDPALSIRFGGNGVVVFFGLAKPIKTPLIGPPQAP